MSSQAADAFSERFRNCKPVPKPVSAYLPLVGSPLVVDEDLYPTVQQARRVLINEFTLPIRSGLVWEAPAGSIAQLTRAVLGQPHASLLSTHDRLWPTLPYMRPLATIIQDSQASCGMDEHGGRIYDLLGTRCAPLHQSRALRRRPSTTSTATRTWSGRHAVGLHETDVHDVINIFQSTGLDGEGTYFMNPCPAEVGDSLEFLAEQDLHMALSPGTCPGGDLSHWSFGSDSEDMIKCYQPFKVQVYELEDKELLKKAGPLPNPPSTVACTATVLSRARAGII